MMSQPRAGGEWLAGAPVVPAMGSAVGGRVVVLVRPGARTDTVLAWLRRLVPAALLLLAPASLPGDARVISLDADEVLSGPLSLADTLARKATAPAQPGPARGSR